MDRRKFVSASLLFGAGVGLAACTGSQTAATAPARSEIVSLQERQRWLKSFACNIEQWFRPMPFLDRIGAAKALGFSAIEMWNPNQPKNGKTPLAIYQKARELDMRVTSYSPSPPNFADPANEQAFWVWLDIAIESGKTLRITNFNVTGHKLIEGLSLEQMIENYTNMLAQAAPKLEAANMVATIEPYNPFTHKGHFIYGNEPALSICRKIDSPSVKLNWDFFHMQRTNGNLITNLENGFDQVAYIQLADSPDRNQPGTGEVAYGRVLTRLRELGYSGYIGAEFFPHNQNAPRAASDLARLAKSINLADPSI
ncbi:TIM barrel protein [Ningiella sp. W23]|uniref:TIM barrel protein n=1 Tax=Ningiella sp. W23 TaxID=3023715 RepID=UPI003757641D